MVCVFLCSGGGEAAAVRKWILVLAALVLMLALSGCMDAAADDLYTLPELSEGYLKLQSVIDGVLSSGAEYAAPTAGANRQPVQREDLDGDGVREVLAFFNFAGSDRPLKIYIFRTDGETYTEAARIEGDGTSIDSVSYLDMDGDGVREIAVGWQMGPGINMLSVYSTKGFQLNQIINTNYTEYTVCNIEEGSGSEVMVLRLSTSDLTGEAELYSLLSDGEVQRSMALLSNNIEGLLRVRSTQLLDGPGGILVESTAAGGGIITDILTIKNNKLRNVTLDETAGISVSTRRGATVYCRDINGDGVLEVPKLVPFPSATEGTVYYMTEWHAYYSSGRDIVSRVAYINYTDFWSLTLPEQWIGRIGVRREEGAVGERMIIFSTVDDTGAAKEDFLIIYTLTGDNRAERAVSGGRFLLQEEEETICSAKILVDASSFELPVSRELVRENFGFIYSEWSTGEI